MSGFDKDLAIRLGFCCQYSYGSSPFLTNRLVLGATKPFGCCDDNTPATSFATLFPFDDCRVLAFQGTITRGLADISKYDFDSLLDWLQNFRAALVPGKRRSFEVRGLIHAGFADQLDWI